MVLDLRKISGFADYFVICSATSEPQLKAVSAEIRDKLAEEDGIKPMAVDGYPTSQWIVMDYTDVVVHIFHSNKRPIYSLEDLWGDAPRVKVSL